MSCKCYSDKGQTSMSFSYKPTCGKVQEGFLYGCSTQSCRNGRGCSTSEPPDDFTNTVSSSSSSSYCDGTNCMTIDKSSSETPLLWLIVIILIVFGTIISFS